MIGDWKIEGAHAYIEQPGPWRDHAIRIERGMLIVNTVGATSEDNVTAELEIPLEVIRAVIVSSQRCGYCGAQQRPDGTWWKLVPMPKE